MFPGCQEGWREYLMKEVPCTLQPLHPQPIESILTFITNPSLLGSANRMQAYCKSHRCFATFLGIVYVVTPL